MVAIPAETLAVLDDILLRQFPKVRARIFLIGLRGLAPFVKEQLRDVVADELLRSGFDKQWAPTRRGLALEDLLDVLGVPSGSDENG